MYQIDVMSRTPVYEQIVNQTEKFILLGLLKPGDKIASVRNLAMELSVNPNTIQKAMLELDRRGAIFSVPGRGCFVAENAVEKLASARRSELVELKRELEELCLAGITKEEILAVIEEVFEQKEDGQ